MERLTFDGNFCDIAQCRELPCPHGGSCTQRKVWEKLKAYEDLGLEPEEYKKHFTPEPVVKMAEYIEREAAIDAIMQVYIRTAGYKARERVFEAKEAVHRLTVADVAPVVHCRHCRSYNKPRLGWCSVHLDREGPDDFCGYGVRMDGDSDALD